jgi:hypothetical protein
VVKIPVNILEVLRFIVLLFYVKNGDVVLDCFLHLLACRFAACPVVPTWCHPCSCSGSFSMFESSKLAREEDCRVIVDGFRF